MTCEITVQDRLTSEIIIYWMKIQNKQIKTLICRVYSCRHLTRAGGARSFTEGIPPRSLLEKINVTSNMEFFFDTPMGNFSANIGKYLIKIEINF